MAQNSKIEWTHHTFNPWRGCTKVSDGCKHCYAETQSKRNPGTLGVWGPNGTREIASEYQWRQPVKWNAFARDGVCPACQGKGFIRSNVDVLVNGEVITESVEDPCDNCSSTGRVEPYRSRVFCASFADVFEGRDTMPESAHSSVKKARIRLFQLIDATPYLDWLLLTKRLEHVPVVLDEISNGNGDAWSLRDMPNVWLGTSVEDQTAADKRVPELLNTPAAVRFLSMEPLLGPVDLSQRPLDYDVFANYLTGRDFIGDGREIYDGDMPIQHNKIDWVIVGGESGPNARPMHPDWARSLRDQCTAAGVPFFFKQWGEWKPWEPGDDANLVTSWPLAYDFGKPIYTAFVKAGKNAAGRLLDGRTWDEMPEVSNA